MHAHRSTHSGPRRRQVALGIAVLLTALSPALGSAPALAAPAGSAPGTPPSDRLLPGQMLQPGQSIAGGHDRLTMQANGNLVLTAPGNTPLWTSATSGNAGAELVMRPNGNLVILAAGGRSLWTSGTAGHSGSTLILRPVGNAVIQPPGSSPAGNANPAPLWSTGTYRQTYADIKLAAHGWTQGQARQFGCLDHIWQHESKWDELAGHPASAYGIPQASPGAKMAAAGPDWLTNPLTQIRWGEDYIAAQYGSPCRAWAYWQAHKNY